MAGPPEVVEIIDYGSPDFPRVRTHYLLWVPGWRDVVKRYIAGLWDYGDSWITLQEANEFIENADAFGDDVREIAIGDLPTNVARDWIRDYLSHLSE